MRMKRWESPRREGRNHKGKKKSARQRQIKKQTQVWRKKLKGEDPGGHKPRYNSNNQKKKEQANGLLLFCEVKISRIDIPSIDYRSLEYRRD
ncbi:hypothetical protein IQ266_04355 [filamentous cyanobacterium LEGE 11480]|uniref:Uncharacterized protein n=1 Tax=Romeriopsis navalis LEGE 11480 TaxID=2777977 RepID=A0A928VI20_9CYAN|nr:hypothetical protein [Romeriopsis navalis]MBE9028993.1 hypothetical protein [Romeriopsis navalis LEGE 11480]